MSKINESELIARCRKGERAAWHELVKRYDRFVFSVARGTGLSPDDAADVTQMAFSALLDGLDGLRRNACLPSWLATVARRQAWRIIAQRRREPVGSVEDIGSFSVQTVPDSHDDVDRWERLHELTCALDRLDPRCRDLITALYLEPDEPSYAELSVQFRMPLGSIGPTRARCLKRLHGICKELETTAK